MAAQQPIDMTPRINPYARTPVAPLISKPAAPKKTPNVDYGMLALPSHVMKLQYPWGVYPDDDTAWAYYHTPQTRETMWAFPADWKLRSPWERHLTNDNKGTFRHKNRITSDFVDGEPGPPVPLGPPPERADDVIGITPPARIHTARCQSRCNSGTKFYTKIILAICQLSHLGPASSPADVKFGRELLQAAHIAQDIARDPIKGGINKGAILKKLWDLLTGYVDVGMILTQLWDTQDGADKLRAAGSHPGSRNDTPAPTPTVSIAVCKDCGSRWCIVGNSISGKCSRFNCTDIITYRNSSEWDDVCDQASPRTSE
ncbi:unnamed protein product, partial [Prorocentrum cordatum]